MTIEDVARRIELDFGNRTFQSKEAPYLNQYILRHLHKYGFIERVRMCHRRKLTTWRFLSRIPNQIVIEPKIRNGQRRRMSVSRCKSLDCGHLVDSKVVVGRVAKICKLIGRNPGDIYECEVCRNHGC